MADKKKPQKRQQVPVLDDATPLHRQLDEYYLQREAYDLYHAPLEYQSEQKPGQRPLDRGEEPEPWYSDNFKQTADSELVKNSTRGSKPFKAAELRCGYRKL